MDYLALQQFRQNGLAQSTAASAWCAIEHNESNMPSIVDYRKQDITSTS